MTAIEPEPSETGGAQWIADEVMDAEIFLSELVVRELRSAPSVGSADIVVTVENAVIILHGRVAGPGTHSAVLRRVRAIPGVFDVCDRLTVDDAPGPTFTR
jgi:osmotically-inducible protein OsmY